ncbi:hypothetical protein HA402_014968 [Bradysia odoriphaga]|nr:hypothetical protein HA402_014968 [Bradysia odoriphaga]
MSKWIFQLSTRNKTIRPLKSRNILQSIQINRCNSTDMAGRLSGKVAVVTASTDGIGFAIVSRLAADGAKVVVSSRKQDNVNRAVSELKSKGFQNVLGVKCHVGDNDDRNNLFKQTVEKFGGLDIFVSNAAVNPAIGGVLDCTEEVWDKIFDINVKASFLLAKQAAPLIRERGGGSIVFISSIAGYTPFSLLGAYSVSKTALFGLTKAVAQDLATEKIRVNCVAPGVVRTKFARAMYETETAKQAVLATIPMGRLAESNEIAGVVSFLVSEDASFITGETITAAGGSISRL